MSASDDGLRIVAADDDPDFLEVLEIWLEDYDDPEVITAEDGEEAVEAVDSDVNVFLCDRRMPELTGDEVIERIDEEGYDVSTIVTSAYEPDSSLPEDEVEKYLKKPIDQENLFEAIDHALAP